jgi:hypothetical protein
MLLLGNLQVDAQTNSGRVYVDSSILYPDETEASGDAEEESSAEEYTGEESSDTYYVDTSLVNNNLALSADSMRALKSLKQFAYAQKLDSLLKDYQEKQNNRNKERMRDNSPSWLELFFTSSITQVLFWGLAIFFLIFIVSKLFFAGGFFQRPTAKSKALPEEEESGVSKDHNYDLLIAKAVKDQNYRLATRYLYLQLLQKLTKAGAIEFAADKTNSEYLRELTGKTYKQEVAALTLNYEYVWYGEFLIDAAGYSKLENKFRKLDIQ